MVLALSAIVLAVGGAGCGGGAAEDASTDEVVAAFYPLAFAAQEVGGASLQVVNLTPAGAEPHDLELGAADVEKIRAARLVAYLGGGFQPALERALEGRTRRSVDVLGGLSLLDGAEDEGADPHVWLDPVRYAAIVRTIAGALGTPERAAPLVARLERLDAELRRGLERCERREVVTSHAAFGYLADRYGLRQVPLTGLSPEAEPSPRDIAKLVEQVRRDGATTVFFEPLVAPDLAETVAREARVETAVLDPLEGLTAEQLAAGEDYFTVMRRNLGVLRVALGCR